jgi:uridine kinase
MPAGGSGCLGQAAARRVIGAVAGWRAAHDASVLLLAIDGHGAAGKSTIAAAIAAATGAALVHTDDFFEAGPEPGGPERSRLGVPAGSPPRDTQALSDYYDWRRLRAEALEPLRAGRRAEFRRFDWEQGRGLGGTVSVTPSPLVVLEGVFSAAPELSDLVDRSVFVDTLPRERLRRLRAQVTPEEWDDDWLTAEHAYFDMIRPPASFDLIVPGMSLGR